MGIPETALHPQELPLDDHSVICLHSLTRLALPVITITRGCGCLINPKQPCVVSIVTYRVTMGRTEIFKFDASTHHLWSCSSIHRTLVLRAIDFSRPFIFIFILYWNLPGANKSNLCLLNCLEERYRQVSNIKRTKSQHLIDSRTVLRLSLPYPLKSDVKSRMKM